jgi:hypothetical protein
VIPKLQRKYPEKLVCVVGNKQVGQSSEYDEIETFKMQNSELFRHFVTQIREADIIIADLTDNNPNVHLELGIALSYNKNILRVTRQPHERLGFDVRNYEVEQYTKGGDLLKNIINYLNLFFKIKNLDFMPENSPLYHYSLDKQNLYCWNNPSEKKLVETRQNSQFQVHNTHFQIRDGKIRVSFQFVDQLTDVDWFGIFLRVGSMGVTFDSILVYVRKSGDIEIATFPGAVILKKTSLQDKLNGPKTLIVELEGDSITANIDNVHLEYRGLDIQSRGLVKLATYRSNAEFSNLEIVCHDTIEDFDRIFQ